MANRRMISKDICATVKYNKMTMSARALYPALILDGDDEGVVEAALVRKIGNYRKSALIELKKKGYVVPLDEDMNVVWISDWTTHNKIPANRFHRSIYHARLIELGLKNDSAESEGCSNTTQESSKTADSGASDVSKMSAEVRKGKDRLGKDSVGKSQSDTRSKVYKNAFNNFEQHPYDFNDLEQILIKENQERNRQEE